MDNAYEDKSEKEEVVEVGDGEKVKIGESKHIHCMAFNINISIYTRLYHESDFINVLISFSDFVIPI